MMMMMMMKSMIHITVAMIQNRMMQVMMNRWIWTMVRTKPKPTKEVVVVKEFVVVSCWCGGVLDT